MAALVQVCNWSFSKMTQHILRSITSRNISPECTTETAAF
jgi:hypothetical protein